MCGRLCLALCLLLASCAHEATRKRDLATEPLTSHFITLPTDGNKLDPSGIAHILRGLYFMQHGHSSAAIPHFRLALLYDASSAYLHQKLAEAWLAEGRMDRAREALAHGLGLMPSDPDLSTIAGDLARRAKRYDEALSLLESGLAHERTVLIAGPGVVDTLAWQGKIADAERRATELMNAFPSNEGLALLLGGTLEDHGRVEAALAAYRRARELKPGSRGGTFGAVRLLDLEGHPAEAATVLTELFAFEPDELTLYVQAIRLFRRAGSPSAEAYRAEALRLAGTDIVGRGVIANGDIVEGYTEAGLTLLHEVVKHATSADGLKPWQIVPYIAEAHLQAGEPQRCIEELRTLEETVDVLRTRATCLAALGKVDEALGQLLLILKAGAAPSGLAFDAARIASADGDETRARRKLGAFLKLGGSRIENDDATLANAALAQQLGRENEALGLISAVYATKSADPDMRLRYADALARNERFDEAVTMLRTLVEEQPENPTRLNALGFTLADAGKNLDEAEVHLRHAYRLASDETFIIDSLGWLLHRRGNDVIAERLLVRASLGSPNDPEILHHLGEVYRARGKREEARACFVKALGARPPRPLKAQLEQLLQQRA